MMREKVLVEISGRMYLTAFGESCFYTIIESAWGY